MLYNVRCKTILINLSNLMKREIEKFPYGTGPGLSETEAKENVVNFCKEYGPLTLRIGLFVCLDDLFTCICSRYSSIW
jgi:hypothetical protein